jgi:hypothetical protein
MSRVATITAARWTRWAPLVVEAGRVLSTKNERAVRQAITALEAILAQLGSDDPAETTEAARLLHEAADVLAQDDSLAALHSKVQQALVALATATRVAQGQDTYLSEWPWIHDLYPDVVVYRWDGGLWRAPYTLGDDDTVTLGTPEAVQVAYVTVTADAAVAERQADPGAAATPPARRGPSLLERLPASWRARLGLGEQAAPEPLMSDLVPLAERALGTDGTVRLKLIDSGWGTSGYYPADVLERDGPACFPAGTHIYWNHQTAQEEAERPEGDLSALAGALRQGAAWDAQGPDGPGLYAEAQVFAPYSSVLDEIAPHIGVSIRASGRAEFGEAEGRQGRIIRELVAGRSADFVTKAGRGGKVLEIVEAARGHEPRPAEGRQTVTEQEAQALREAAAAATTQAAAQATQLAEANTRITALEAALARQADALRMREAREIATAALASVQGLGERARARALQVALAGEPPLTEAGVLDAAAVRTRVQEAATAELEYLAAETGQGSGAVRGLGGTAPAEVTAEQAEQQMAEAFRALGLSEQAAATAASGRGR